MLPKKIDKKHMGSHVPRLAFLPCKERVEGSIPIFFNLNTLSDVLVANYKEWWIKSYFEI